jgi:putative membrane protein
MKFHSPAFSFLLAASLTSGTAAVAQKPHTQAPGSVHPNQATKTVQGVKSQDETSPEPNRPIKAPGTNEKEFLKAAAIGDAFEIQMGQLAQQNGSSEQVKDFAKRMVKDHSQNDDQLKGVAQTLHIALPTELDAKHKAQKDELAGKQGSAFDKDYARLMVQDHEKTVAIFKKEAAGAHDPTIKKYAQGSLPVLESHLADAKKMAKQVGAAAGGKPPTKK